MGLPVCSIIVVNYNGKQHLDACLRSFKESHYPAEQIEILVVDNGSQDGSDDAAARSHPRVRLVRNPVNNFAAALNLGVVHSTGSYIGFANNDVFVDPEWLIELVKVLEESPRAGCAGGKILFENGRLNSVGLRALPDFYWEDEGYNQLDQGQYDAEAEREGLCWAAVLFRKSCLLSLGPIDEDFVLYYEDVDTSLRCRQQGWKLLYNPRAVARHVFHGSSQGSRLTDYFIDRGRLIYVAKHRPENLARVVENSRFVTGGALESLYDNLPVVLKKLIEGHPPQAVEKVLEDLSEVLVRLYGSLAVDHLLARMQVILGYRKMSVGFYDQALHVIGGGQRYGCTMAAAIQDRFDVTLMGSRPVTVADLESWYGLPLTGCELKQLPIPFFDRFGAWIDSDVVTPDIANPFDTVSAASQSFDVFVNVNMLAMVRPLSPFSIFLCHFPNTIRRCYFFVDEYTCLIVNSLFTGQWVKALWGLDPDTLLYPPVEMTAPQAEKENLILSVARYEPGGSKKQLELIGAFEQLRASHPDLFRHWRLVLVGGSLPENPYLDEVQRLARKSPAPVEVRVNISIAELKSLYARAKVFWHARGLDETNPRLIQHFGMSTVEAMQNRCVPIVFNGGGQRETVEHGRSGYRFDTVAELREYTRQVAAAPALTAELQQRAYERSQAFTEQRFKEFVRLFFQALADDYRRIPVPDPRDVLQDQPVQSLFHSPVDFRTHARGQFASRPRTSGPDVNMLLQNIRDDWDQLGKSDAFWGIISEPSKRGGKWNSEEFFHTGATEVAEVMDYLKSLDISLNPGRALDFGCGAGRVTQALGERFEECIGVDIAPSMINLANKFNRLPNKCKYVLNETSKLSMFADSSFDFVYSNLVLQHMPPECSSGYITEFVRILRPGGVVLFQIPSGPSGSDPNCYRAEISTQDIPERLEAGREVRILARIKNTGEIVWPSSGRTPVRLANHWWDEGGNIIVRDDGRTPLPHDLPPGEEVILELAVRVPSTNGAYTLELDMVQEHITWFAALGSATARRQIRVSGGRPKPPEVSAEAPLASCRSLGGPRGEAALTMYALPKQKVVELACKSGAKLVDAHRYEVAGQKFVSYRYCFTK